MISESHNPFVPIDYFVVLFKHFFYPSTIHHCVLHFPKQKFDTKDPYGAEHGALLPRFPSRIFGKRSNRTEDKNPASVCPNRDQSLEIINYRPWWFLSRLEHPRHLPTCSTIFSQTIPNTVTLSGIPCDCRRIRQPSSLSLFLFTPSFPLFSFLRGLNRFGKLGTPTHFLIQIPRRVQRLISYHISPILGSSHVSNGRKPVFPRRGPWFKTTSTHVGVSVSYWHVCCWYKQLWYKSNKKSRIEFEMRCREERCNGWSQNKKMFPPSIIIICPHHVRYSVRKIWKVLNTTLLKKLDY